MRELENMDLREEFLDLIKKTLIGPKEEHERISEKPTDKYLYGLLWPSQIPALQFQSKESIITVDETISTDDVLAGEDNEPNSRESLPSNLINRQSCIGISFSIPRSCQELKIEVSYGVYKKEEEEEEEDSSRETWARIPISARTITIDLRSGYLQKKEIESGRWIEIIASTDQNDFLCTVTLINKAKANDSTIEALCEAVIFQPRLKITLENDKVFSQRPIQLELGSHESKMYEILYESQRPICFGHGISTGQSDDKKAIWTEWMPHFETRNVDKDCKRYFGDIPRRAFNAREIGEGKREDTVQLLRDFVGKYVDWISMTKARISEMPKTWRDVIGANIEVCDNAANRIKEAIDHLLINDNYYEAFRQANKTIALQNNWKNPDSDFIWRPFQLGFFLLVMESFISEKRESRSVADLLWFPTGGGKTEAYLGIMAFLLFKGSYHSMKDVDPGTQILVRYTLRLLTKQQFERTAALVLASELVRRTEKLSNDEAKPFSIGLWIGSKATPNSRKEAKDALLHAEIQDSDPRQLLRCPCCKSDLEWKFNEKNPIRPNCSNPSCDIYGELNVYTVDEDIYNVRPSIILGTSDKFIQIARNPDTSKVLNSSSGKSPELILQDELHLISGPLGSVAGLFEVTIDMICSQKCKAKIIGSTATIKSADGQIRSLFNRSCLQFPPSGIDYRDSCFALEDKDSPGRLYIGSSSVGRSPKFALASLVGACFYYGSRLADKYSECKDKLIYQAESYTTIVAYFNSLKELGGAAVLFQDDVIDRLKNLADEERIQPCKIKNQKELTSTRSQDELQEILIDLEKTREDEGHIDICLSTNMISVGVDVSRLGLMVVNGQPKSKSEYIQATSRVGRKHPGIVVTLYNDSKIRDKSAFESFHSLHANIYKDVEVTSVTPFSPPCIDKVLPTAFVAACRHLSSVALTDPQIDKFHDTVDWVQTQFLERCTVVSPENTSYLEESIKNLRSRWLDGQPNCYISKPKGNTQNPLFVSAEKAAIMEDHEYIFSLLSSVRSVEPQCKLRQAAIRRR